MKRWWTWFLSFLLAFKECCRITAMDMRARGFGHFSIRVKIGGRKHMDVQIALNWHVNWNLFKNLLGWGRTFRIHDHSRYWSHLGEQTSGCWNVETLLNLYWSRCLKWIRGRTKEWLVHYGVYEFWGSLSQSGTSAHSSCVWVVQFYLHWLNWTVGKRYRIEFWRQWRPRSILGL